MASEWSFLWLSDWFAKLSAVSQRVYLYAALHPRGSGLGIIRTTPRAMATEFGTSMALVDAALERLKDEVMVDEDHGLVFVRRHVHAVGARLPSDVPRWGAELDALPDCPIRREAAIEAARWLLGAPVSRLAQASALILDAMDEAKRRERERIATEAGWPLPPAPEPAGKPARREPKPAASRPTVGGKWLRVPFRERLTTERRVAAVEYAIRRGIEIDVSDQWRKFTAHVFKTPRQNVDAAWLTFLRAACDKLVAPKESTGG